MTLNCAILYTLPSGINMIMITIFYILSRKDTEG